MNNKLNDDDIIQLLATLKNSNNNYPQDMIASRRDMFVKQAAAMAVLMKAGIDGANTTGTSATTSTTASSNGATTTGLGSSLGGVLETVLVIAIVAEVSVAAYVYREKIADFINSALGTKVEQISTPPDNSPGAMSIDSGTFTETSTDTPIATPTTTETKTPTLTATITIITTPENNNGNSGSENTGNPQVASTPPPNNGNGNHYGNTPKPERTKDNQNNSPDNNDGSQINDNGKKK